MQNKAAEIYDAVLDRAAFCRFITSQHLDSITKFFGLNLPNGREWGIGLYLDWLETDEVKQKIPEESRTKFLVQLWRLYEAENMLRIIERALGCDAINPPGLLSKHSSEWKKTQDEIGPLPEVLF